MLKGLFTAVCLLWVLSPSASAQSAGFPARVAVSDDVVFANVCAPDLYDGLYEESRTIALDDGQLAKLRIELLERGRDPGFDPNAVDADAKLTEAIEGFQAEFSLPVTGQADATTLWMLSIATDESSDSGI